MSIDTNYRTMDSSFKISGFFSISPEGKKFPGELDYDSGMMNLKIQGSFGKGPQISLPLSDIDYVYGWTHENQKITLCSLSNTLISIKSGISNEAYRVDKMFIGAHIKSNSKFYSMNFNHELLEEWLSISPFSIKRNKESNINITLTKPESIETSFKMNEQDVTLKTLFKSKYDKINTKNYLLSYKSFISLSPTYELSSDWFIDSLFDLVSFFTNLIGRGIYIKNVDLFLVNTDDSEKENKVELYFNQIAKPNNNIKLSNSKMPFPFNIIKDNFNSLIYKWFNNKKSLSTIYDILYSDFHSDNYLEMDYINIIYGLEGYHRINHSDEGKYVDKATYRRYLKEIKASLSTILSDEKNTDLYDRLSNIIGTSNEVSLRTRIIKLLNSIQDLDLKNELFELSIEAINGDSDSLSYEEVILKKIETFATTVTKLRNSLTHIDYDEKKPEIEIDYDKIFEYKKKLKRLLFFHVLHSSGLPQKFVLERIKESKYL